MKVLLIILCLSGLTVNAQDWPNLSKYEKQNDSLKTMDAKKPQHLLEKEKRVVFMGNSITELWSNKSPGFFENPLYVNRGISGQTTPQMLLRFRQDVIDLKPKIVVILAGTNDIAGNTGPMSLEQIKDNILSMVELAEANHIKPIICSILPVFDYSWRPGLNPDIKIPKLNSMLKNLAEEKKIFYLDYFSEMADNRNGLPLELAEDGVHPNAKGYKIMEILVEKAIKSLE
ncbi:hypothetical protein HME9304_03012 [Flagellimonas maritima]|uniref:SGNH hydrolase-type esterase domain-containing protein n=1 Tax=Flagellimonas maritima TaxID=1383885 RepID=A0A2Z4LW98_9FLAO|nr:SGNH/GDSL hydrolase family protein [Allomuricauda aurantiaca]AWX45980.1 hypothetical protein HME9304_03012 [Allomuricauda aurantiaca]